MITDNIGFYEDLTKIIFQLSSNMHLSLLLLTCDFSRCTYRIVGFVHILLISIQVMENHFPQVIHPECLW